MSFDTEYILPPLGDIDYGLVWPRGPRGEKIDQITKELAGFKLNGRHPGFLSRYEHGLNLIRLLWPTQVEMFKDWRHWETGKEVRIWHHFFMDTFKDLCEHDRVGLTGSASSGKTFAVAVYSILLFPSDPQNVIIMVSTTAATDAERRVWGDIKALHKAASERYPVGTLIDYLKVITFDPGKELEGNRDVSARDVGSGIILIPIPKGSDGENSLGKIIGTKNQIVVWIVDELPNMIDNIMRPESNLEGNPVYQFIGIGNANRKNDPHGKLCHPVEGYDSINDQFETWISDTGAWVRFLHGGRSPNFHPAVNPKETDKTRLPFPYLSNRIMLEKIAFRNGRGNIEVGRQTIDYVRFGIGFWYGDDISRTILTTALVKQFNANKGEPVWNYRDQIKVAGFDPAFTTGGDNNELMIATIGWDQEGNQILFVDRETITIRSTAQDREGFRYDIARQVVDLCKQHGVLPNNLGIDIGNDAALMVQAIQKVWNTHDVIGLSSTEKTDDETRFQNRVTQYWYQVQDAICTGRVRGFNTNSRYSKHLCERFYESVAQGKVKVEKKADMKDRIGESPDAGDSFCYMLEMAKRRGFRLRNDDTETTETRRRWDSRLAGQLTDDSEYFSDFDSAVEADEVFAHE